MPRRLSAVAVAVAASAVLAAPAAAHVTVNPREAEKGGFATLTFQTPNERPDSGTVKLEVTFPPEQPLAFVSVRPTPGWTATVERAPLATPLESEGRQITEAVSRITWQGGTINPGEFQQFVVSAGPMPEDADQMTFPALQTYASGEVVRWIEEAEPGGEEPERPAPVLALVDGADEAGAEDAVAPAPTDPTPQIEAALASRNLAEEDDVDAANRLSVVALVVGALGALGALGGLRRRRGA